MIFRLLMVALVLCTAPACSSLSETECLSSSRHTLSVVDDRYQCRKDTDHCAIGFVQAEHGEPECAQNTACEFVPANCYCPPDVVCICGGGPPAQCRSKVTP